MIDEIRSAYTALRAQPRSEEANLAVLPLRSVSVAYAGLDDRSRQHLLLATEPGTKPPAGIATLSIGTRALVIDGRQSEFLDITCLFEGLAEVFDHFASTVLERQRTTGDNAAIVVTAVLEQWREFLVEETRPLGRDKLAAIIGELLVVLDIVQLTGATAFIVWVGPSGNRHDIRGGTTALEIKTTQSHTSRLVTIHGEDQLVAPDNGLLYLHFVRLEQVPGGGQSVFSLTDDLLSAGVPTEALFRALADAGVPAAQLADTADITFDVRERMTVLVDDETPKIVPSSFVGGRRPGGVVDISYVIDLDRSVASSLDQAAHDRVLIEIAEQGAP